VAASRLVHPHLVGVYDAIDEGQRAYVVREWVPGVSLRDIVVDSPLDGDRSLLVIHAVSEAVAALHSAGIAHGNVHPGSVLVADDGRVVLADTHVDTGATSEDDVRAIGGLLYACMTGRWPAMEAGHSSLPDAPRDAAGRLAALHQVRAGVPRYLDALATDLLDPRIQPPPAANLAAELQQRAAQGGDPLFDAAGPIGFEDDRPGEVRPTRRRSGGKIAVGIAVLSLIATGGVVVGLNALRNADDGGANEPSGGGQPSSQQTAGGDTALQLRPDQVRIVDPPRGNRTELAGVERVVDGKEETGWRSEEYRQSNFGSIKPGMGILINLGTPTQVKAVKVVVNAAEASIELRSGNADPGNTSAGDDKIRTTFQPVGQGLAEHRGTSFVFPVDQQSQYLLVWISKLPPEPDGGYRISVNEISVVVPA
jgi:hypothetical protein